VTVTKPKLCCWYLAVLGAAIVLYAISCAPGALWQDSGLIHYRIWHNDIEGFLGLAISHPLFYILAIAAKYVPLGEYGYRVNLVSAVAAAVAVANLFLFVRLLLDRSFPAIIAAVTLAVSHTFWAHASIIETYTLWAALFFAELIMLLQYTKTKQVGYLYWLGLLNGLAIADHMLASIPLACYSIFLLTLLLQKRIRLRHLGIIILLWVIGALPYEYLIIKNILQTKDVAATLASAAFGNRWQGDVLNTSLSAKIIKESFLFILLNFPTPNILLFFVGFFAIFKLSISRAIRNVLLGAAILFFVFAFRYTVPDRYAFFIPFYCAASVFMGLGTHHFHQRAKSKAFGPVVVAFSLLPIVIYAAAPTLAKKIQLNLGTRADIPYRNDYEYFLQPWKTGYRGAEQFAEKALQVSQNDSLIYADMTTVGPLVYAQEVKGKRPDVKIVSAIIKSKNAPDFNEQTIAQLLNERTVYVVSRRPGYCPAFVLDNYDLVPAGILWRLVEREKKIPGSAKTEEHAYQTHARQSARIQPLRLCLAECVSGGSGSS
jgi:hypothetical protein